MPPGILATSAFLRMKPLRWARPTNRLLLFDGKSGPHGWELPLAGLRVPPASLLCACAACLACVPRLCYGSLSDDFERQKFPRPALPAFELSIAELFVPWRAGRDLRRCRAQSSVAIAAVLHAGGDWRDGWNVGSSGSELGERSKEAERRCGHGGANDARDHSRLADGTASLR